MTYLVGPRSMKQVCRSRQQALKLAERLLKDNPTTEVRTLKGDGSEEVIFNPAAQEIRKSEKTGKRGVRNKKK